jgi:hypothetical protein
LARFGPNSPIILDRSSADGWMKLCLLCIKGSPNPIPLPPPPLSLLLPPLPLSHPTPSPSLFYRSTAPHPFRSPPPPSMPPRPATYPDDAGTSPPTSGGSPHAFPPPSSSPSPPPLLAAPTAEPPPPSYPSSSTSLEEVAAHHPLPTSLVSRTTPPSSIFAPSSSHGAAHLHARRLPGGPSLLPSQRIPAAAWPRLRLWPGAIALASPLRHDGVSAAPRAAAAAGPPWKLLGSLLPKVIRSPLSLLPVSDIASFGGAKK